MLFKWFSVSRRDVTKGRSTPAWPCRGSAAPAQRRCVRFVVGSRSGTPGARGEATRASCRPRACGRSAARGWGTRRHLATVGYQGLDRHLAPPFPEGAGGCRGRGGFAAAGAEPPSAEVDRVVHDVGVRPGLRVDRRALHLVVDRKLFEHTVDKLGGVPLDRGLAFPQFPEGQRLVQSAARSIP